MSRRMLVIALVALIASACSSSRTATSSKEQFRVEGSEFRDSVKVESVAVSDSVTITKTIMIRENEQGDTLRMTTVTDRTRIRDRERAKDVELKVVEKHDTVFVQKTDSVLVANTNLTNGMNRASPVVQTLKWVFWIIIALAGLIITITITKTIKNWRI